MRNVSEEIIEKIKLQKSCRLRYNVEKYGTVRQATHDNIMQHTKMRCAG